MNEMKTSQPTNRMLTSLQQIFDVLFFVVIVGIGYYAYIIYILLSAKVTTFQSAYFRIFVLTGIFDIMAVMANEWSRINSKIIFGPWYEVVFRIMLALTFTNLYIHIFGCLLLTVNRFTAICWPVLHSKTWTNKTVRLILTVVVVTSFAICSEIFFVEISYKKDSNGVVFVDRKKNITVQRILIAATVVLYEMISTVLIVMSLYTLRQQPTNIGSRKQEAGLIAIIAISVFVSVLEVIYEVSLVTDYESAGLILWIQEQFDAIYFGMMTINAYTITMLSGTLRMEIKQRWFGQKSTSSAPQRWVTDA